MNKDINLKQIFNDISEECKTIGTNFVVANAEGILESYSYGMSNLEENIESKEDTIYRIASISKTVGAIGLMQLVEKGLIDLDEDISTYLGYKVRNPHYPDEPITVRMITLQTSSIQDGYDDENPIYDDIKKGYNGVNGTSINVTLQDLLTNPESEYYTPLTFGKYHPGTRFCYSNFGCGIMACIIEKVSGETYVEYMENHVFKPLNLDASFKAARINKQEKIATMYSVRKGGLKDWSKEWFTSGGYKFYPLGDNYRGPAGGLFISMKDLSTIMRMFLNYGTVDGVQILKKETVEQMYQMQWCGSPLDTYKAKAIQMKIQTENEIIPVRGHTGSAYGVRSFMFFNVEHQIGACFITNGFNIVDDGKLYKKLFKTLQKAFIEKYVTVNLNKVCEFKDNEIVLKERTIRDKGMYLLDKKYIKAINLVDALDILPTFKEDDYTLSFKYNGKDYFIDNTIYYKNNLYIPFEKTLDLLEIKYTKDNNLKIGC